VQVKLKSLEGTAFVAIMSSLSNSLGHIALCACLFLGACVPRDAETSSENQATLVSPPAVARQPSTFPLASDLLVVPGERIGIINAESSRESLLQLVGAENVRDSSIYVGEGQTRPGTVLFPQSEAEVEILWHTADARCPETVILRAPNSSWSTAGGLKVGSRLSEVVAENEAPIAFWGFDWDYQGYVTDWSGGRLNGLFVRFNYPPDGQSRISPEESRALGRDLRSEDPVVQRLDPVVYQWGIGWPDTSPRSRACIGSSGG